jgi:hypothetical protein
MPKGTQVEVMTPGTNDKHDLAGALNLATGTLHHCVGARRLVSGAPHRHAGSPGDERLLSPTAGARESAESGDDGRHAHVPHHPERAGEQAPIVERQGQPWACPGTRPMSPRGRGPSPDPSGPAAISVRRSQVAAAGWTAQPWGAWPAGPDEGGLPEGIFPMSHVTNTTVAHMI